MKERRQPVLTAYEVYRKYPFMVHCETCDDYIGGAYQQGAAGFVKSQHAQITNHDRAGIKIFVHVPQK